VKEMVDYQIPPEFAKDLYDFHVVIYVPSTKRDKPIPESEFKKRIEKTIEFLTKLLGGTTTVQGIGTWKFRGKVYEERVAKVENFSKVNNFLKAKRDLLKFIKQAKKNWQQNTITYELEESMGFYS